MARRESPRKQPARLPRAQTLHTAHIFAQVGRFPDADHGSPEILRVNSAVTFGPVAMPNTG
jgi:hypothetical protein